MPSALMPLLTFVAVGLALAAVFSVLTDLFARDKKRVQDRLDVEFHNKQREKVKQSLLFKKSDRSQSDSGDAPAAVRLTWSEWLQVMIDQAGLELSKTRLLTICGGAAAGCGLLLGLAGRNLILGLVGLAVGALCPIGFVNFKRNARLEALRKQLSDAFDLMARILRAGQSMAQAMHAVASEFPTPISEEFAYCSEQQNLGLSAEISLRDLARRTGLVEMNIFVVAVLVQRQVGGNLSEILEKLAFVVRQRYKTRGMIHALTAEGRMQAAILMAMPPLMLVAMLVLNPKYEMELFKQPILLGGMAVGMLLGGLWIRKIVNFDF